MLAALIIVRCDTSIPSVLTIHPALSCIEIDSRYLVGQVPVIDQVSGQLRHVIASEVRLFQKSLPTCRLSGKPT